MKVDALLPVTAPVDVRDLARRAEHDGYAGMWTSETTHDPFMPLALAGTTTDRIDLGTSIALAFARNPMSLAQQANDLHALTGGRFVLGLGSQIKAHITRRFSMPWSSPAARMREYVLALHAIWDCWNEGTPLDFRGEFYSHTLMPPLFVPGPNPHGAPLVMLAGVGEVMTRAAGEVADGFLCHGLTTERYLRTVTLPALERGRALVSKNLDGFEVVGTPLITTGRTEEELADARRGTRAQIAFYASTPAYRPVLELHGWGALSDELHAMSIDGKWQQMGDAIDDDVLNVFAVVGEPDQVAAELLRRYGDVMTRMTLYAPYELDPAVAAQIARDIHDATA